MKISHGFMVIIGSIIAIAVTIYYLVNRVSGASIDKPVSAPEAPPAPVSVALGEQVAPVAVPIGESMYRISPVGTPISVTAPAPILVTESNIVPVMGIIANQVSASDIAAGKVSIPKPGDVWNPATGSYNYYLDALTQDQWNAEQRRLAGETYA